GPVPAVIEGFPLALADQLTHVWSLPALESRPERLDVGPPAGLVAVRAHLPVDLGHDHVFTDQARHHADPAAMRVLVVDVLEDDRVVPIGNGQPSVVLPPLAVLVVPAGVLVLEPLEVLVCHRVHTPVVGQPPSAAALRHLGYVALVPDLVPSPRDEVVRDPQAVLLKRNQIDAVVVAGEPPPPHLGVALAVLA